MIKAYYNEFDPKCAAWLRQLIKNGNITQGEVDERSITEVRPEDIEGFDRVHFFAGVGTWDYCLNQSGWGDKPIWTASLPCQPFSTAGKGLGKADERHLLPHFLELFRECKPTTILGEQVAAAIGHGWLDDLYAEMEACDYAIGSAVIGAHSINAPHIRQRLYWVANSNNEGSQRRTRAERTDQQLVGKNGVVDGMANTNTTGKAEQGHRQLLEERLSDGFVRSCEDDGVVYSNESGSQQRIETAETSRYGNSFEPASSVERMGNADNSSEGEIREISRESSAESYGGIQWIYCRDNKYRPIKSSILPLVNGTARGMVYSGDPSEPIDANATQEARAMRLKGYGNAIQAQTAIAFITAFMGV